MFVREKKHKKNFSLIEIVENKRNTEIMKLAFDISIVYNSFRIDISFFILNDSN